MLETCMYFPFTTAKALAGFGPPHSEVMRAYPRQQQVLVLSADRADARNRITVDWDGRPVVHYRFTPEVIAELVRGTRAAARIFFAAGATHVHAPFADPPLIDAWDAGRIDELIDARHWQPGKQSDHFGAPDGRVPDGLDGGGFGDGCLGPGARPAVAPGGRPSLFPDALEINPYVTIMALADRVAEGVRRDLAGLAA